MYIVTIMFTDKTTHSVTTGYDESIFNFLWMLEVSNIVSEFRVSDGSSIMSQESFHYGEMKKWVIKFNYGRDNNVLD